MTLVAKHYSVPKTGKVPQQQCVVVCDHHYLEGLHQHHCMSTEPPADLQPVACILGSVG